MAAAEQTISFDDILEAVRESRRGRWFLDEFERRLRHGDTAGLLTAIAKLENVMAGMASPSAAAELLAKAKAAIASARKDIAVFSPVAPALSQEGRLFANLADLARKSFSAPDGSPEQAVGGGVLRALKLVDELEHDLCGAQVLAISPPAKLIGQEPSAFFQQDAEVFEAPAQPKTVDQPMAAVPVAAKPDLPARGAKLVINRVGSAAAAPQQEAGVEPNQLPVLVQEVSMSYDVTTQPSDTPAHVPTAVEVKSEVPVLQSSKPTPVPAEVPRAPRVVIIRKKPEEMMEVPLMESQSAA